MFPTDSISRNALEDSMKFRNTLLALSLLTAPTIASADYLDVITNSLNDGCSIAEYGKIVEEFRPLPAR